MERKYLPIIAGLIFSIITFTIIYILTKISSIPQSYFDEFVISIPGPLITDIILFYALPIAFFLLFYLISPYLIQFYIYIHKFFYWLMRRPSKYGLAELGTKIKASRILYRLLIVSFFSFSISVLMVQMGLGGLFRAWEFVIPQETAPLIYKIIYQTEATFLGTFLISAIVIILFFPIWLLEDSGLVSYRVFHEERMPIDIQGVHSLYNTILLGYAGFTSIFYLIRYIILTISMAVTFPEYIWIVAIPILFITLPFIIFGVIAIPVYLYERYIIRNQSRIKEKFTKFNFPNIKVPHFEEMKD